MCTSGIMYEFEEDNMSIDEQLRGWDFDMKRLKETERGSGGVSLSPPKVPRADFTNVHPASTILKESEWCHYGGLPSPNAYQ